MVIVTYSQQWVKKRYHDRLMSLWRDVITAPTPDLWIKIFFYRDRLYWGKVDEKWYSRNEQGDPVMVSHPGIKMAETARFYFGRKYVVDDMQILKILPATNCRGNYRYAGFPGHGFYEKEWKFIRAHPKMFHCITLKIGESSSDRFIANLMAHEYRHYRQWKKYGGFTMAHRVNGRIKRPIRIEDDANKWARERIKKLGYNY